VARQPHRGVELRVGRAAKMCQNFVVCTAGSRPSAVVCLYGYRDKAGGRYKSLVVACHSNDLVQLTTSKSHEAPLDWISRPAWRHRSLLGAKCRACMSTRQALVTSFFVEEEYEL